MSFSSAIIVQTVMGDRRVHWGTFESDGDDGGDIDTGLELCEMLLLIPSGSSDVAKVPTVNETLPVDGSAVTIDNGGSTDIDGYWIAFGY